jgi:hypothetical protein
MNDFQAVKKAEEADETAAKKAAVKKAAQEKLKAADEKVRGMRIPPRLALHECTACSCGVFCPGSFQLILACRTCVTNCA